MKKLALLGLGCGLALHFCRAEIEITDTPANPVTRSNRETTVSNRTTTNPARPVATISVKPEVAPEKLTPAADADVMKFRNGDAFHGTLLSLAPATGVRWQRADVNDPVMFDLETVAEIALAPRMRVSGSRQLAVELTNGDRLEGDLVALDEKGLTLKTWYAGTLTIEHQMLQRVGFLNDAASSSYTGPNSIDEWKTDGNRNSWSYRKGALYGVGSGMIGRDVKIPDMANIEFDLAWRGQVYVNFGFGFDDVRQIYNSGGYLVQISYSSIMLQRYRPQHGNNNFGNNVEMPELMRKNKLHISLRVNKPKKLIALYLDGTLMKQWTESEEWCGRGTGLVFGSQGQCQSRISNISVTSWDGRLDGDSAAGAKDSDMVQMNNGDKVSGTVKKVADGQVILAASFAEMKVPMDRISGIEFASQKTDRVRRNANDVRAFFPAGNRVTFALDKLDAETVSGSTENFGKLKAALGAFRRIQFHIYDKPADGSDDDEWGTAKPGATEED